MMNWKKFMVVAMASVMTFSFAGCQKKETEPKQKTENVTGTTDNEKEKEEELKEEIPANENLLTGVADLSDGAIGKRPVAVMVNNHEAARPQYGIAEADIIYEIPVEGDLTRLMAIYGDYTAVPQICPVRSCRYYFPAFSQGYDAFYVNWGIDDSIADYLEALNLDQYDVVFLGYPNWNSDLPMPLYTFLEQYDFNGKTIIPFTIHGGSGFSRTVQTIEELQPGATVVEDGLSVSRNSVPEAQNDVASWVAGLDMFS